MQICVQNGQAAMSYIVNKLQNYFPTWKNRSNLYCVLSIHGKIAGESFHGLSGERGFCMAVFFCLAHYWIILNKVSLILSYGPDLRPMYSLSSRNNSAKSKWASVKVQRDSLNVNVCTTTECNCGLSHFLPQWTLLYTSRWRTRSISYRLRNDNGNSSHMPTTAGVFGLSSPQAFALLLLAQIRDVQITLAKRLQAVSLVTVGH